MKAISRRGSNRNAKQSADGRDGPRLYCYARGCSEFRRGGRPARPASPRPLRHSEKRPGCYFGRRSAYCADRCGLEASCSGTLCAGYPGTPWSVIEGTARPRLPHGRALHAAQALVAPARGTAYLDDVAPAAPRAGGDAEALDGDRRGATDKPAHNEHLEQVLERSGDGVTAFLQGTPDLVIEEDPSLENVTNRIEPLF